MARVVEKSNEEWTALTAGWPRLPLTQAWAYGTAKADDGTWAVERGTIGEGAKVVGAFQALIKRMPGGLPGGLAWISRGPTFAPDYATDATCFESGLKALRQLYAVERGLYLRIAPNWPDSASNHTEFSLAGPLGWRSASLDLTPDEDTLRKGLKQKWRNALNKAERAGLVGEAAQEGDAFEAFLADHDAFTAQAGFSATITGDFLRSLQRALPETAKMTAFRGLLDGDTLGWVLSVRTGDTVEYLAGNSTDAGRRLSVGQFLLWRAIVAAKAGGAQAFDLGGVDEALTPSGILRFKQGVGGVPYALAPEIEAMPSGVISGPLARLVRWRVNRARDTG